MNCREMKRRLADYAEGEVAETRAVEIEAHLAVCAACRARLETLHCERLSVRRALQALPRIQASPDFERRVLESLPQRMAQPLSLFDRLDAIFARPVCKLLGSSVFGLLCGLLMVSLLVPRSMLAGNSPTPSDTIAPSVLAAVSADADNADEAAAIRQLRRFYALGHRFDAAEAAELNWLNHVEKVEKQATQEKPSRLQSLPRSNKKESPWNAGISVSPSSSSSGSLC